MTRSQTRAAQPQQRAFTSSGSQRRHSGRRRYTTRGGADTEYTVKALNETPVRPPRIDPPRVKTAEEEKAEHDQEADKLRIQNELGATSGQVPSTSTPGATGGTGANGPMPTGAALVTDLSQLSAMQRILSAISEFVALHESKRPQRLPVLQTAERQNPPTIEQLNSVQALTTNIFSDIEKWTELKRQLTASQERTGRISESITETRAVVDELKRHLINMRKTREEMENILGVIRALIFTRVQTLVATSGYTAPTTDLLKKVFSDLQRDYGKFTELRDKTLVLEKEQERQWPINITTALNEAKQLPLSVELAYSWQDTWSKPSSPGTVENVLVVQQQTPDKPVPWYRYLDATDYRMHVEYQHIAPLVNQVGPVVDNAQRQAAQQADHEQKMRELAQLEQQFRTVASQSGSAGDILFVEKVRATLNIITHRLAASNLANPDGPDVQEEFQTYWNQEYVFRNYRTFPAQIYREEFKNYITSNPPPPINPNGRSTDNGKLQEAYVRRIETRVLLRILRDALTQSTPVNLPGMPTQTLAAASGAATFLPTGTSFYPVGAVGPSATAGMTMVRGGGSGRSSGRLSARKNGSSGRRQASTSSNNNGRRPNTRSSARRRQRA